MTINICHLWPDALNWNGSMGNLVCLKKRLEWRGIQTEISTVAVGEDAAFDTFDLIYIGAGKVLENIALQKDAKQKAPLLREHAAKGGAVFAVCEGYELLGQSITTADGTEVEGLGVLGVRTVYGKERLTGNAAFDHSLGRMVFFENHAGLVYLEEGVSPWGTMVSGHGNNGRDKTAGAFAGNVFGCHAHGPLLPKNPALADEVLQAALSRRWPEEKLFQLDDALEKQAHAIMEERL